ncbi:MAG TPA: hypothetical protein VNY05_23255 [Candidatus Acidoferrales bacterium]|nr:hypothetical protein [Candidatus Acidoferrales bacterium]
MDGLAEDLAILGGTESDVEALLAGGEGAAAAFEAGELVAELVGTEWLGAGLGRTALEEFRDGRGDFDGVGGDEGDDLGIDIDGVFADAGFDEAILLGGDADQFGEFEVCDR